VAPAPTRGRARARGRPDWWPRGAAAGRSPGRDHRPLSTARARRLWPHFGSGRARRAQRARQRDEGANLKIWGADREGWPSTWQVFRIPVFQDFRSAPRARRRRRGPAAPGALAAHRMRRRCTRNPGGAVDDSGDARPSPPPGVATKREPCRAIRLEQYRTALFLISLAAIAVASRFSVVQFVSSPGVSPPP